MNQLIALIMALTFALVPASEHKTIVTKIHEDDQITVLTNYQGKVKERTLHGYDFNIPIVLSENIPTEKATGKFTNEYIDVDGKKYYQFKSNDDSVWWTLTESDMGIVPSMQNEYTLLYCNNGTTKEHKGCDCLSEYECECEVYDDVFVEIYEEESK